MTTVLQRMANLLAVTAMLSACTPEPATEKGRPADPVVVYAAYADKTYLPTLFTAFTATTGQAVVVRNGTVPAIVDDVLQDRTSPPADVLLTPSVAGVWRAAEEGELRPNYSTIVATNVPTWLRDPDNYWVALSYRNANFVYDPEQFAATELSAYEDLADAKFRRKLCLSSSALPINRSVLSMLIRKLGPRDTELTVRSWVANLALPAFDNEDALLRALESGDCAVAIVSSNAATLQPQSRLRVHTPNEAYTNIEGLGITRHARNPDGAAALVDWLLDKKVQTSHAGRMSTFPVLSDAKGSHELMAVAVGDEEARLLAERARYR